MSDKKPLIPTRDISPLDLEQDKTDNATPGNNQSSSSSHLDGENVSTNDRNVSDPGTSRLAAHFASGASRRHSYFAPPPQTPKWFGKPSIVLTAPTPTTAIERQAGQDSSAAGSGQEELQPSEESHGVKRKLDNGEEKDGTKKAKEGSESGIEPVKKESEDSRNGLNAVWCLEKDLSM